MNALPYIPDYIIESALGEGGMATVYLAIQQKLNRKVAIKVLDPAFLKNKVLADRFMIEAQTAANLSHPNIISIYDVGQVGKLYYIVMELLDGSLKDLIKNSPNHRLPPKESLGIISKIAPALDYAHKQGIIHRDIKPDNIMFRSDGTPVLVDFGIARAVDTDLQMTKTGMGIGTPHYMSPEQCKTGPLDGRSDFYSLGVVLYELLTGEKPYKAETILAMALRHIQDPVPKLPAPLARYQPLVDKMMAKNKEDRVQNGTELQQLIDKVLREPAPSHVKSPPIQTQPPSVQIPPIKPATGTHPILDAMVKPDEIGPVKPIEVIEPVEPIKLIEEPIEPVEPVEPVETIDTIDTMAALEAEAAADMTDLLKRPRFEDPPVPDWFRESLERTTAVESPNGQNERKPYKKEPRAKSSSRTFIIILLIVLVLITIFYFLSQGKTSKDISQENKPSPRKNIETKSNIPGKATDSTKTNVRSTSSSTPTPTNITSPKNNNLNAPVTTDKNAGKSKKSRYSLRNTYQNISTREVQSLIERYGFYDTKFNPSGRFKNDFENKTINGNPVIIDHNTGLVWHPGGSDLEVEQKRIPRWLKELNGKQYAGYSDWRLPTLAEAISLLKWMKNNKGLYIDPIFSWDQNCIWTGDQFEANNLWVVRFYTGTVLGSKDGEIHFIRPVRSMK